MHRLTMTPAFALLPVTRVAAQQIQPSDTDSGPVIHGRTLTTGSKMEFLLGIAHPLAPYKLHFP